MRVDVIGRVSRAFSTGTEDTAAPYRPTTTMQRISNILFVFSQLYYHIGF